MILGETKATKWRIIDLEELSIFTTVTIFAIFFFSFFANYQRQRKLLISMIINK